MLTNFAFILARVVNAAAEVTTFHAFHNRGKQ